MIKKVLVYRFFMEQSMECRRQLNEQKSNRFQKMYWIGHYIFEFYVCSNWGIVNCKTQKSSFACLILVFPRNLYGKACKRLIKHNFMLVTMQIFVTVSFKLRNLLRNFQNFSSMICSLSVFLPVFLNTVLWVNVGTLNC